MGKNKHGKEDEHYKGQIRKLESENRSLKKKLRSLEKRAHFYEDLIDDEAEKIEITNNCPNCKKGVKIVLDLKHVQIETCTECDYRKKV